MKIPDRRYIGFICGLYGDAYDDREEDSRIGGGNWVPGQRAGHKSIRIFQQELEEVHGIRLSRCKIQKILVSGGRWSTERSREVQALYERCLAEGLEPGNAMRAAAGELGISAACADINLPYGKAVYGLEEKSANARRIERHRAWKRQRDYGILDSADDAERTKSTDGRGDSRMKTTALIMAGGRGERFWPMSRRNLPKQFLSLVNDDRTMIQATVDRILPLVKAEDIFVVTGREYREKVREQLPEIPEGNILCEPAARSTAPAIGWGAVKVRERYGDAVMLVLPSDHLIRQPGLFRGALKGAVRTAEETGGLVTLGIAPSAPETGYGYIRYDAEEERGGNAFRVRRFVEKPDAETAKEYLRSGDYLWNSGMFIWKASAILEAIREQLPEHAALLEEIRQAAGTAEEETVLEAAFGKMAPISVDYGVMEKAKNAYVIPSSFGWDDVGSWTAVERYNPGNADGNVVRGDAVTVDSSRCIIQGGKKLIALVGMEDTIVVDTEDALLVCARDSAGEVRKVLEALRQKGRTELL